MRVVLQTKHREPGMAAAEQDGTQDGTQDEDEEDEAEPGYRMNDARLAKSGLKRDGGRAKARTKAESEAHDREVHMIPKCDTCRGRHRCHPCPNSLAREYKFDAREAEMKGVICNYQVSKNFDTIRCQGKGHVAAMHEHVVNEQLRRGAPTDPRRNTPKGVTGARGPKQTGGGTRPSAANASRGKAAAPRGKSATRRSGAPSASRPGKPKGTAKRGTGRPVSRPPGKRREPARVAGEETDGEDNEVPPETGDGEDQDNQTEDEVQTDGNETEPVDVGGEPATDGEQTEDDDADAGYDQDDVYDQDGNLKEVEPGGLAATYGPRQLRTLDNMGPYSAFDLDAFFPGRFNEPGRLLVERALMFRGAPQPRPAPEKASTPRGRSSNNPSRPGRADSRPQRQRSSSAGRAASVTPTVDRATLVPGMPPKVLNISTGFNCAVSVRINELKFRMTLDSGAARSIIRKSFAEQLRKTRETRGELYGPQPLSRTINIEGITQGRTSELHAATQIRIGLADTVTGHLAHMEVSFGEMENASETLILGFPDMTQYGFSVEEDDDGNIWVEFRKLGVTLLCELPDCEGTKVCRAVPLEPRVLVGPCCELIQTVCDVGDSTKEHWI